MEGNYLLKEQVIFPIVDKTIKWGEQFSSIIHLTNHSLCYVSGSLLRDETNKHAPYAQTTRADQ